MLHIGIDVHQKSSVFSVFDPAKREGRTRRSQKVETTAEGFRQVLEPHPLAVSRAAARTIGWTPRS